MAAFGSLRKKDIEEVVAAGKSARERLHEKVCLKKKKKRKIAKTL
jgi:hypothetical protein